MTGPSSSTAATSSSTDGPLFGSSLNTASARETLPATKYCKWAQLVFLGTLFEGRGWTDRK